MDAALMMMEYAVFDIETKSSVFEMRDRGLLYKDIKSMRFG